MSQYDFSDVDNIAEIAYGWAANYAQDFKERDWNSREETPAREALKWAESALDLAYNARRCADELARLIGLTDEEYAAFQNGELVRRFYTEQELLRHDYYDEWTADMMAALHKGVAAYETLLHTPWKPKHMREDGDA